MYTDSHIVRVDLGLIMVITLLATFMVLFGICSGEGAWRYSGPKGPIFWVCQGYHECGGFAQTPIDFPSIKRMNYNKSFDDFKLTNFDKPSTYSMNLTNNGHTATVEITNGSMIVQGGGLGYNYTVAQFHWHWGHIITEGSEHTYMGQKYPAELHIVTYNSDKYSDLQHAFDKPDGLAVLGFFYEQSNDNNTNYDPLLEYFKDIESSDTFIEIPSFSVRSIIPTNLKKFFRYNGGLTTPPCHQSVTWTIFQDTIKISEAQLNVFRSLNEDGNNNKILVNHRPLQARNHRVIYISYDPTTVDETGSGTRLSASVLAMTWISVIISIFL